MERRGLNLIELMIVIMIAGIFAAMIIGSDLEKKERVKYFASELMVEHQATLVAAAAEAMAVINGRIPQSVSEELECGVSIASLTKRMAASQQLSLVNPFTDTVAPIDMDRSGQPIPGGVYYWVADDTTMVVTYYGHEVTKHPKELKRYFPPSRPIRITFEHVL